jgi:hypothetical protein
MNFEEIYPRVSKLPAVRDLVVGPSGRGTWWDVLPSGVTQLTFRESAPSLEHLDVYIVMRALNGCPDCIAAIIECPDDHVLQGFVRVAK